MKLKGILNLKLKENSIDTPDIYNGAKLRKVETKNGEPVWLFSPSQYVQAAMKNNETHLRKKLGDR